MIPRFKHEPLERSMVAQLNTVTKGGNRGRAGSWGKLLSVNLFI